MRHDFISKFRPDSDENIDDPETQILTSDGIMSISIDSINDIYLNKSYASTQNVDTNQNNDQIMEIQATDNQPVEVLEEVVETDIKEEEKKKKEKIISNYLQQQRNNLLKRIRKQMEFYFSDKNYYIDKFLLDAVLSSKDGFIPVEEFLTFNKIKRMNATKELIIEALKESEI